MRGLRGTSRPQRQARSEVVYKESDDDDEEFVPNARSDIVGRRTKVEELGIAKGKRTLTLKRARALEPPVVSVTKEDVDVYGIPEEQAIPSPGHSLLFPQVYESAERVLNPNSSAFAYLLEAVSGASGDGDEDGGGQSGNKLEQEEEMTSGAYGPELLAAYSDFERKLQAAKGGKEEGINAVRRSAHSSDEESRLVQGMKDTVVTERDKRGQQDDRSSGDEKKYIRRSEKVKLENKQEIVSSDDKKSRETEDKPDNTDEDEEEDADAEDSWNESSDASDTENQRSVKLEKSTTPAPAKKPSEDLKISAKNSNLPKSDPGTAGRILMPAKSTSVPPLLPKKRPALWVGTKPFVPPGPQTLHTPTVAHRRVVGLSRRHRPPPLHPYLLGS